MTRGLVACALLASTFLVAPTYAASPREQLEAALGHDGLKKITVKGIDLAYARPGATLAGYGKVQLEPIEVAFRKDWNPERTGSRLKLSEQEREHIRTGVAKLVHEEFVKELQAKGGYQVVNQAGPDVLRIRTSIANLYATAPDTNAAARSRTYVVSAGEMTLVMELFDSETGQVLARVVDRKEARSSPGLQLSNSVMNAGEAQSIAHSWARILRNGLDKAHGIGKK